MKIERIEHGETLFKEIEEGTVFKLNEYYNDDDKNLFLKVYPEDGWNAVCLVDNELDIIDYDTEVTVLGAKITITE